MKQLYSAMKYLLKRITIAYMGIVVMFPLLIMVVPGGGHSIMYAAALGSLLGPAIALGRFDWLCGYSRNAIAIRTISIFIMSAGCLWLIINYANLYSFFAVVLVLLSPPILVALVSEFILRKPL